MRWWCSATGEPWTWAWRAYPGVWLFVLLLGVWYWRVVWRARGQAGGATVGGIVTAEGGDRLPTARPPVRPTISFAAGLVCIWLSLDWPIGALGAGYLTSVHTVTYILLTMVAPPLLLLGIPPEIMVRGAVSARWGGVLRFGAKPWFALLIFNAVVLITHMPATVDQLMASQVGAFVVDLAWMIAGLALWWPVMGPSPEVVTLKRPMKMAYLFASTLLPIIPSAFLTFAQYPLYATYELAPRIIAGFSAQEDQQVAGLLMKIVGDLPVWFGFAVIFFRWSREGNATHPGHPSVIRP